MADDEDFEARRLANIAANMALLESLGLNTHGPSASASPRKRAPSASTSPRKLPKAAVATPATPDLELRRSQRKRKAPAALATKETRSKREAPTARATREPRSKLRDDSFIDDETNDGRQRAAQRLGKRIHNPKTFGAIPGIEVGTTWMTRMDCSTDAVHAPPVAGIAGSPEEGCWSIVLSGGGGMYSDDADLGESFTYTGSGGCLLRALRRSAETKKPVRVVRGYKNPTKWAPVEGYVYSGLYRVERAWLATGLSGFKICRYALKRIRGQAPLPVFDDKEAMLAA